MKKFALTSILLILLAGTVWSQNDPFNAIDTVSIGDVTVTAGQEFSVSVNLWNDEELGAVTLPLVYPVDKLEYIGTSFIGSRVEYVQVKPVTPNAAAGTVLIGVVVIAEAAIPAGSGRICTMTFKAKDGLLPGEIMAIDTTFIAPTNHLMLSDPTGVYNFTPAFTAGQVTIGSENRPPYFATVPDVYVAEGDSLYINVNVTDSDGDSVIIVNPIHPYNSLFTDYGDGTGQFAWRPDYIGPLSADMGPFYFIFWTSDGQASSYIRVKVNVINVNRAPVITAPQEIAAEAGDSLGIHVSSFDPDFETTEWEISGLPDGASFDFENPGLISWNSDFSDSGTFQITLISTDPYSLADTAIIDIELLPVTLFSMRIDTVTSFSGRIVTLDVSLKNKLPVSEFNILLALDPSVLTTLAVDRTASRCAGFDTFTYNLNDNGMAGLVRVIGRAGEAAPMGDGDGTLFSISVQISSNLNYVGQQIPVRFYSIFSQDNHLGLDDGTIVYNSEINLFDGYILISADGTVLIGDINLNGIAYEISDAVYFTNFFITPSHYRLNELQLLNSDINRDGYAPSIADLIQLIKIITGISEPIGYKPTAETAVADVELVRDETGVYVSFDSPIDIGGALLRFVGSEIDQMTVDNLTDMDMESANDHGVFSFVFLSYENKSIASGEKNVVKLSDNPDLDVTLNAVELADVTGAIIATHKIETPVLPTSFELLQNYPNPFNPTTEIKFNLTAPVHVTLTVFNILGQEVIRLADKDYPAGQFSVRWDSRDRNGGAVASGIYLYRIQAGDNSASRKMVLVK